MSSQKSRVFLSPSSRPRTSHTVSQGLQQALGYGEILDVPSAFSSNGDAFASHNKVAAAGVDIETRFELDAFPRPDELWQP
jgi:type I restriction enzyme R subunit